MIEVEGVPATVSDVAERRQAGYVVEEQVQQRQPLDFCDRIREKLYMLACCRERVRTSCTSFQKKRTNSLGAVGIGFDQNHS